MLVKCENLTREQIRELKYLEPCDPSTRCSPHSTDQTPLFNKIREVVGDREFTINDIRHLGVGSAQISALAKRHYLIKIGRTYDDRGYLVTVWRVNNERAKFPWDEKMKFLKCGKCRYVWVYRGRLTMYATCPQCKGAVRISTNEVGVEEYVKYIEEDLT